MGRREPLLIITRLRLGRLCSALAAENRNGEPWRELISICLLSGCDIPPVDPGQCNTKRAGLERGVRRASECVGLRGANECFQCRDAARLYGQIPKEEIKKNQKKNQRNKTCTQLETHTRTGRNTLTHFIDGHGSRSFLWTLIFFYCYQLIFGLNNLRLRVGRRERVCRSARRVGLDSPWWIGFTGPAPNQLCSNGSAEPVNKASTMKEPNGNAHSAGRQGTEVAPARRTSSFGHR